MPLYIKNSSSVIKYFHFYYNAQIYLYDNTSFDKRKHLFRNREQKNFRYFLSDSTKRTAAYFYAQSFFIKK